MSIIIQEIKIQIGEYWWGGVVNDGVYMPFGDVTHHRSLEESLQANQGCPLLISNKGRYVWAEEPFSFSINEDLIIIKSKYDSVEIGEGYENLQGVFRYTAGKFFKANGICPDSLLFTAPQYNLWIELQYEPDQDKVLEYAQSVLDNGMPPGVIMIDDNWFEYYGKFELRKDRFENPRAMVDKLHKMGFKVMLWTSPFVSPDTEVFRYLRSKNFLLRDKNKKVVVREWWNGFSAILDFTNEEVVEWFQQQLDRLIHEYGIDGFKFDAGDLDYYEDTDLCAKPTTRNGHCEAWGKVGLKYRMNEYRACWKLAGTHLVQRLRDKRHEWGMDGLATLIPNALAQGLMGYSYNCPDMIGGGQIESFVDPNFNFDSELFVRYAQCSALFPMMQFSAAPWRLLDKQELSYVVAAAKLHAKLGTYILELAENAAHTGEPIMRNLSYVFPIGGYEKVTDQFMLGEDVLVAPVLKKGEVRRTIVFPEGTWHGDDGSIVEGPCIKEVDAPLSRLPWYIKRKDDIDEKKRII